MLSVCLPTYNGQKFIKLQLSSILSQLDEQDEIIISDDSSSDETLIIIEQFNDPRIRIFKNNKFYSPIFNLENALNHAKGDIILLADQDDIWEQTKVSRMKKYLDIYDLVVSDCSIIDEKGDFIEGSFFKLRKSGKGFWKNLKVNTFLGCCMGFRKELLQFALPFPQKTPMHDIWLGLIAEIYGKTRFVPEKLIKYRRHGNNASFGGANSGFSLLYQVNYRITTLALIIIRIIKLWFKK